MANDQPADQAGDEVREVLTSEVYESAFAKVMSGNDADLTDAEHDALARARRLTGTEGPGHPLPWKLDPTRAGR